MGGQNRHDQCVVEKLGDSRRLDPLLVKNVDRFSEVVTKLRRAALPVLGEVGEHREEHEAADEIERFVLAQRAETGVDRRVRDDAAIAIHRGRADIFDAAKQGVAAILPDDVAEDSAKETDVGILLDGAGSAARSRRLRLGFGYRLVHDVQLLPSAQTGNGPELAPRPVRPALTTVSGCKRVLRVR